MRFEIGENGYVQNYYWDFSGPVVTRWGEPYKDLIASRTPNDYTESSPYALPPNFRRSLLTPESTNKLYDEFYAVQERYPGRFNHFDIHLRNMCSIQNHTDPGLPWDILTYVLMDGIGCYMPINVSFSHQIMTAEWSSDPDENLAIQRGIIEKQLFDILYPYNGPNVGIYGVSFAEKFAYGKTDTIFSEFLTYFKDKDPDAYHDLQPIKKIISVNNNPFVIYFFKGRELNGNRKLFEEMIHDPACIDFCQTIATTWDQNFQQSIESPEDRRLFLEARGRILKQLGAIAV